MIWTWCRWHSISVQHKTTTAMKIYTYTRRLGLNISRNTSLKNKEVDQFTQCSKQNQCHRIGHHQQITKSKSHIFPTTKDIKINEHQWKDKTKCLQEQCLLYGAECEWERQSPTISLLNLQKYSIFIFYSIYSGQQEYQKKTYWKEHNRQQSQHRSNKEGGNG